MSDNLTKEAAFDAALTAISEVQRRPKETYVLQGDFEDPYEDAQVALELISERLNLLPYDARTLMQAGAKVSGKCDTDPSEDTTVGKLTDMICRQPGAKRNG